MAKAISQEERMRLKKERSEKRKETLKKIGKGVGKTLSTAKEVIVKNPKIREGLKEAAKVGLHHLADNETLNKYLYGVPKKLKEFVGPVVDAIDTNMGPRYVNPKRPAFDYQNDAAFNPFKPGKPNRDPSKPLPDFYDLDQPYKPVHTRFAVKAY